MVADGKGRRRYRDSGRGKGKGRTLPAEKRPWHKAYAGPGPVPARTAWKQAKEAERKRADRARSPESPAGQRAGDPAGRSAREAPGRPADGGAATGGRRSGPAQDVPELLFGRNPVREALRAEVPATALWVALGIDIDDRVNEVIRTAADRGVPILEVGRAELDRMAGGVPHQGIGLQVPPYEYSAIEDLLPATTGAPTSALLVALDGVTDPRNLGAVIRSAAAFGAHGVILPRRRAAGVTATAWRTSAGAAARLPVARVANLTRGLKVCQEAGCFVIGLDADAGQGLYDLPGDAEDPAGLLSGPVVLVVGSEGRGLSRLVGQTCDLTVAIPMASQVESLNASVAAAVALAEVSRRRAASRVAGSP